jgi:DNA topoisomerase-1
LILLLPLHFYRSDRCIAAKSPELKEKAESKLRGDVQSFKPEEAAVLALLRGRLAKEAERPATKKQRAKAA